MRKRYTTNAHYKKPGLTVSEILINLSELFKVHFDFRYSKEPMFITKPRSSEAFEGDTVIIQCEVIGDPKPEVIWLRDFLNVSIFIGLK